MSEDEIGSERSRQVGRLFDALATTYDAVGVDFFGPIAAGLLEAVPPTPGEWWIDIGVGRGAVLLPAADVIGDSGRAVGTDISAGMLAACRDVAQERGLAFVELLQDDAQEPVVTGEFDTVTSSLVLFFLADPLAALQAWLQLLRPGGRLGVTTFGANDARWDEVDDVFTPYLPPDLRDARTTGAAGPFGSDAGMEALVADAGFTDVRTVVGAVEVRFADPDQWHAFTWSVGQRRMWMGVPEGERDAVRAEAYARLARHAAADGSVTFVQGVRHTLARRP
jgi:ubiquinone/menaquinone biosynthesis C-methylase UbiE